MAAAVTVAGGLHAMVVSVTACSPQKVASSNGVPAASLGHRAVLVYSVPSRSAAIVDIVLK